MSATIDRIRATRVPTNPWSSRLLIEIRRHALVRHSPEAMFDLVDDVEAYPTRFPWCAAAKIVASEGEHVRIARLDLRFAGLTQSFTTRNTAERPHRLHMHLVEGPLKSLEGEFTFAPLGNEGCKIALALDFEYSGVLAGAALRLGFQGVASRMVDDFVRAAHKVYG
jgi:ribosome-associated toxin RatA of RatAB toxin-antitoxin module